MTTPKSKSRPERVKLQSQPETPQPLPDQPIQDPPVFPERDGPDEVIFDEEEVAR